MAFLIRLRNKAFLAGYKYLVKPVLFRFDPEDVHDFFVSSGNIIGKSPVARVLTSISFNYKDKSLEQEILGLKFSKPIGLAGGFDKHADLTQILQEVGFGFMEIGSITAEASPGNLGVQRLKRLPKSNALQVYYGLKNDGAIATLKRLEHLDFKIPLGINIAKTNCKKTANREVGIEDYFQTYNLFSDSKVGDYFVINISCPNAYGGQPFHDAESLDLLLGRVFSIEKTRPTFLKISPDLNTSEIDAILKVCEKYPIDGFICTNLTKDFQNELIKDDLNPNGGISGKVVKKQANELLAYVYKKTKGKYVMIGLGGVFTAEDAYEKIQLGASLVQLITGMVFRGPSAISDINLGLANLLKKDGYDNISQAIGTRNKW